MTVPPVSGEPIMVDVALAARSYEIVIGRGVLSSLGDRIARMRPGAKAAIVTDETVARHHLAAAQSALARADVAFSSVVVPPGENSKKIAGFETVCEALIEARIDRGDVVIALGGGVIGDLAGFAAATVRRGIDFIQVPTSLLAQVDSSIGGKTAINSRGGKNLIGAFHQPVLVLADTALLDTLPQRQLRNGYTELVKHGFICDAEFFSWLDNNWREVFSGGPARDRAVARSCRIKADVVARDERENGDRKLLNLGHTFGHALEADAGFSGRLLHGEAIAIGIALAFSYSAARGLMPTQEMQRAIAHLDAVGLPTRISQIPGEAPTVDRLMAQIAQDKKVKRGRLTFILSRGIGKAFVEPDVDPADIRGFLEERLAAR